jgi:hypothetical protein
VLELGVFGSGGYGRSPVGTQWDGLLWTAAVGNFVPEIVPGSDGTLENVVLRGHAPVKASFAKTIAKVGVAGSNPVVRSKAPPAGGYRTSMRSTTKTRVSSGPITPPAPLEP